MLQKKKKFQSNKVARREGLRFLLVCVHRGGTKAKKSSGVSTFDLGGDNNALP